MLPKMFNVKQRDNLIERTMNRPNETSAYNNDNYIQIE